MNKILSYEKSRYIVACQVIDPTILHFFMLCVVALHQSEFYSMCVEVSQSTWRYLLALIDG